MAQGHKKYYFPLLVVQRIHITLDRIKKKESLNILIKQRRDLVQKFPLNGFLKYIFDTFIHWGKRNLCLFWTIVACKYLAHLDKW